MFSFKLISINTQYPEKRGWGLEQPKGERTTRYSNIHHLSQTISSPFFPHTSQTFPCEAQVPLNSPPLRNINLTDINIKNKEINPIVISSVIISINILIHQDILFFNIFISLSKPSILYLIIRCKSSSPYLIADTNILFKFSIRSSKSLSCFFIS